jgi:diguanylate cyclase (GGDEF)-like protein
MPKMNNPSEVLSVAAGALAVTAASLTGFGRQRGPSRGWYWWLAALWLTAAGVAFAALSPRLALPAALLLIQWPILTLIGLRRFHSRTRLPLDERADWAVLVMASCAAGAAVLWPSERPIDSLLPCVATVAAHLYAASLLLCGPGGQAGLPLRWLGLAMAMVALAPLPTAWPRDELMAPIEWRAVAAALGAVVMAFVVLTLMYERAERQLRDSRRRLRVLANMDSLTNVPNRRHFVELATLALRADRPGSATLVMFDIDHFKRINDQLGHSAGDRALRLVSESMLEHLRAHDLAGRQGGDEFALLLRQTRVGDAGSVAERMVAHLQEQARDALLPPLTLSFGMVQVMSSEGIADAMRRADQALYESKRQRRSDAVTAPADEVQPEPSDSRRLGLTG